MIITQIKKEKLFLSLSLSLFFYLYMQQTLAFNKLWSTKLHDSVNCLAVGKPFLEDFSEENDILIGTTAGRVLILNQTKVTKSHCMDES